ncbi:MAG: hypothetical protein U1E87_05365 [Alphaproteobacteria bacterium]
MRLLFSLVVALAVGAAVYVKAPSVFPDQVRAAVHGIEAKAATAISSARGMSLPKAGFALGGWTLAGSLAAIGLTLGAGLFILRGRSKRQAPAWLEAARVSLPAGRSEREHLRECNEIDKVLVPDIRMRGQASLARAHQLDLFARYVGRSKALLAGTAKGAELADFRRVALATLQAAAPSIDPRPLRAFREVKPSLFVLAKEDSVSIRAFYDALGARQKEQEAAWREARDAIEAKPADQKACVAAMEKLRAIHHSQAQEAAMLVGGLEISVRAVA